MQSIASGEDDVRNVLLARHEVRLRRMVTFRLDARLQGRVDPSDVLQEVLMAASLRLADYLREPPAPFYLWLRGIASNKLLELHRHHLGTPMRDARREVPLDRGFIPEASSVALAAHLVGKLTSPSEAAIRIETRLHLQKALDSMEAMDREILVLRHIEQLTSSEAAEVLGIKERAASKRHLRALQRLRTVLGATPGDSEGLA